MSRRPLVAVAAASTVLLLLSGCTLLSPTTDDPGIPSRSPVDSAPTDVDGFYAQKLTWADCFDGMKCTYVVAPIDWDDPAAGAMQLAVVNAPASGKSQGSLLVNPGGPGGSGVDFVSSGAEYAVSSDVAKNFDVIGWDPRGVGASTPLVCFTNDKDIDTQLYGTYDAPYGTDAWITELTAEDAKWSAACEKNTGPLLAHLDSVSTAKDMDLMRGVFGDKKLNYMGYSYGTYIGALYAELFPKNVGRFVLDGVVDPSVTSFEGLKIQMAGFDSAFRAYLAFCLGSDDCPFTGTVDNAAQQARAVFDSVDARGLVNSDGRKLDSATLGTGVALNLYSQNYWPDMTSMFNTLADGDPSEVFQNADYYNSRGLDGSYADNSIQVYFATSCADGDFLKDDETTLQRIDEIDAAAPILGKFFAYDDFAVLDTACTHWPVAPVTPPVIDADGAPPILLIGTTNDPATPYSSTVALAKQMTSAVLITHNGEGHTVYNQGNVCIDSTVDDYFIKGTVPSVDPNC
jgi:pimeloyl-ACP methyl ester carboxylesterase